MRRVLSLLFVLLILLLACKGRKKTMTGEDTVTIEDFIAFFPDTSMPFTVADTQINRKLSDSLLISEKVFSQFAPDSVYQNDYGKKVKPKLYAIGKITDPGKETYLLLKAATLDKQIGYILCFDKDNKFMASMQLIRNNPDRRKSLEGSIDRKLTITKKETQKTKDGRQYYKLDAYVYNTAGVFTLIKIESNEPVVPQTVYNPIDTFPQKDKLSGDYVKNNRNFVSIRDGKNAKKILFFAHFEAADDCLGELKGEATLIKPNLAQYRKVGDACVLRLLFSGNKVTLSEEQACGNYRGITCSFDGTYTRKKVPAVKSKKKKN